MQILGFTEQKVVYIGLEIPRDGSVMGRELGLAIETCEMHMLFSAQDFSVTLSSCEICCFLT